jgi:tRNA(adenine34) deaminase
MDEKELMGEAFKQAQEAYGCGECPVGAIIVRDETIPARAGNREIESNDPTAHAEILVPSEAGNAVALPSRHPHT